MEKLQACGYNETISKTAQSKVDMALIESNLPDLEDYSDYVEVYKYEEPCVEIIRAFLNNNDEYIKTEVFDGEISAFPQESAFRSRYIAVNYPLDKRLRNYCNGQ